VGPDVRRVRIALTRRGPQERNDERLDRPSPSVGVGRRSRCGAVAGEAGLASAGSSLALRSSRSGPHHPPWKRGGLRRGEVASKQPLRGGGGVGRAFQAPHHRAGGVGLDPPIRQRGRQLPLRRGGAHRPGSRLVGADPHRGCLATRLAVGVNMTQNATLGDPCFGKGSVLCSIIDDRSSIDRSSTLHLMRTPWLSKRAVSTRTSGRR
jgi:hypothetical protein